MPSSKFEASTTLILRVRCGSFSILSLASSFLNDYFRAYMIIDFLANRLVFVNTVTYYSRKFLRTTYFVHFTYDYILQFPL